MKIPEFYSLEDIYQRFIGEVVVYPEQYIPPDVWDLFYRVYQKCGNITKNGFIYMMNINGYEYLNKIRFYFKVSSNEKIPALEKFPKSEFGWTMYHPQLANFLYENYPPTKKLDSELTYERLIVQEYARLYFNNDVEKVQKLKYQWLNKESTEVRGRSRSRLNRSRSISKFKTFGDYLEDYVADFKPKNEFLEKIKDPEDAKSYYRDNLLELVYEEKSHLITKLVAIQSMNDIYYLDDIVDLLIWFLNDHTLDIQIHERIKKIFLERFKLFDKIYIPKEKTHDLELMIEYVEKTYSKEYEKISLVKSLLEISKFFNEVKENEENLSKEEYEHANQLANFFKEAIEPYENRKRD